jgi:hypothetical protein
MQNRRKIAQKSWFFCGDFMDGNENTGAGMR